VIGIFGGTFDPIHYGHLRPGQQALHALELQELRFIPAAYPHHRQTPVAPCEHRLRMVQLAVAEHPGLRVDDRETRRDGPSYTVVTLESLRAENETEPMCLLMGTDAFQGIESWYRWERLLQLSHIVVLQRPGWRTPGANEDLPVWARGVICNDRRQLSKTTNGLIIFQSVTPQDISASKIRMMIARGESVQGMLPDVVLSYIRANQLYGYSG
jgi:nicotinate-nucleotide adenylyltransferase